MERVGPKYDSWVLETDVKSINKLYSLSLSHSFQDERTNGTEVLRQFSFSFE